MCLASLEMQRSAGLVLLALVGEVALNHKERLSHTFVEMCRNDRAGFHTDVQHYPVTILIEANDRHGLLSDITWTLSDEKINVLAVNTMSNKSQQTARMAVTVEIRDLQQLTRIMDKISQLRNVLDVRRGATGDISLQ